MNLFFDARWTRTDYHDGISRYTSGLLEGFLENNLPVTAIICDVKQLDLLPLGINHILVNHPVSIKELWLPRTLNKSGADVVFSPLQVMGFWGRKYSLILTLQDIIYYRHPKPPTNLAWYIRVVWRAFHMARWPQRLLLNRADHVATVSETSKVFIQGMKLTSRPIDVIYNATSTAIKHHDMPSRSSVDETTPGEKNILYMGSFMPYKNAEALIDALEFLPPSYSLHLLSRISSERKAELEARIPKGARVVFHNGISEHAYAALLASAHCLATASKEEGFGLPVVEAQTYGTPVVCTDMDIFHEVADTGALFCNPDSPEEFANAIRSLEDPQVKSALIEKGFASAARFSWSQSAKKLWAIAATINTRP